MNKIQIKLEIDRVKNMELEGQITVLQQYKQKLCSSCKGRDDCWWYEEKEEKVVKDIVERSNLAWLTDLITKTCNDALRM